jgi:hypothetical protein
MIAAESHSLTPSLSLSYAACPPTTCTEVRSGFVGVGQTAVENFLDPSHAFFNSYTWRLESFGQIPELSGLNRPAQLQVQSWQCPLEWNGN